MHTPSRSRWLCQAGEVAPTWDTKITHNLAQWCTVSARPQSAPKYVCYAQHTADLISSPALIRVGYLEGRECRERSFLQSRACVCERGTRFIVLANLLNRSRGGEDFIGSGEGQRSCWFSGQFRKLNQTSCKFTNIYSCHSPPTAAHCKGFFFFSVCEVGRQHQFWICLHGFANPCGKNLCSDIPCCTFFFVLNAGHKKNQEKSQVIMRREKSGRKPEARTEKTCMISLITLKMWRMCPHI